MAINHEAEIKQLVDIIEISKVDLKTCLGCHKIRGFEVLRFWENIMLQYAIQGCKFTDEQLKLINNFKF